MVQISVVLPVHNGESYISRSMMSVLNQSLEDLELICVNDGSTDKTLQILNEFAGRDQRIKIISYETVQGAAKARKDGILQASAPWLMFLDADDYLERDACEILLCEMKKHPVDILHFSTQVENCGAGYQRTERMQAFTSPYRGQLKGDAVFFGCFEKKQYRFNLWNKMIRTEVCQKAMDYMPDGFFPKANDLYAYFLIAFFAESYRGVITKPLYHYCFGLGSTGNAELSIAQLERYCQEKRVSDRLNAFIEMQHADQRYADCVQKIDRHFLRECLNNWIEYLNDGDSAEGFDLIAQKWSAEEIAAALAVQRFREKGLIAKKLYGARSLQSTSNKIQTIGIFYFRIAFGGVQRVISLQIPLFLKLGYRVVLLTEEEYPGEEYEIPQGVIRVALPSSFEIRPDDYEAHGLALGRALREQSVDFLLYHAGSSDMLLYDMLIAKMQGIRFCIMLHEMFSQRMVSMDLSVPQKPDIYRLADRLIVLSQAERQYWKTFHISAQYIPNPVMEGYKKGEYEQKERTYILWIGRLASQQKQFEDAVQIMRMVAEQMPDAQMKIVGNEVSKNAVQKLEIMIQKAHLENRVEVLGFQKDVDELYQGAKIHLLTSAYESFPMTIIESKSHGVPLVTYELPYLELLKDGKGYVSVPQGDCRGAARAIIKLLRDEGYREKLGNEARVSIEPFLQMNQEELWKKALTFREEEKETEKEIVQREWEFPGEYVDIYEEIIRTMLFHYGKAAEKYEKLQKKKQKAEQENQLLKSRPGYRLRRKLGKIRKSLFSHF